jgi:hypothetical protein
MKNITKKEAKQRVTEAINYALQTIEIEKPSKKTRKLLKKVSRKLTSEVKSQNNENASKVKSEQKKKEKKEKKGKKDKVQLNHKAEALV